MKRGDLIMELLSKYKDEDMNLLLDMLTLQKAHTIILEIGDESLKKKIIDAIEKIGEDYGNEELLNTDEVERE